MSLATIIYEPLTWNKKETCSRSIPKIHLRKRIQQWHPPDFSSCFTLTFFTSNIESVEDYQQHQDVPETLKVISLQFLEQANTALKQQKVPSLNTHETSINNNKIQPPYLRAKKCHRIIGYVNPNSRLEDSSNVCIYVKIRI